MFETFWGCWVLFLLFLVVGVQLEGDSRFFLTKAMKFEEIFHQGGVLTPQIPFSPFVSCWGAARNFLKAV